ncbi:hypothetical protein FRB96_001500 [Tulasnella sp. 330]|nr:hypothetical protein FRB96_001500 [Tulasnella sp. 330]KAG8890678.1 hypothetical protein FRB98_006181 [Tulasnella sp. 332]
MAGEMHVQPSLDIFNDHAPELVVLKLSRVTLRNWSFPVLVSLRQLKLKHMDRDIAVAARQSVQGHFGRTHTPLDERYRFELEFNSSVRAVVDKNADLIDSVHIGENGTFFQLCTGLLAISPSMVTGKVHKSPHRLSVVTELHRYCCDGVDQEELSKLRTSGRKAHQGWLFPRMTSMTVDHCFDTGLEIILKVVRERAAGANGIGLCVSTALRKVSIRNGGSMDRETFPAINDILGEGAH